MPRYVTFDADLSITIKISEESDEVAAEVARKELAVWLCSAPFGVDVARLTLQLIEK